MSRGRYRPRCFCTEALLPDGTCRHGCDRSLRAPHKKALIANARLKERSRGIHVIGLGRAEAAEGCLKAMRWLCTAGHLTTKTGSLMKTNGTEIDKVLCAEVVSHKGSGQIGPWNGWCMAECAEVKETATTAPPNPTAR